MKKLLLLVVVTAQLISLKSMAQDAAADTTKKESPLYFEAGLDILNNFIWRGLPLDKGPCLQPALFVGYGQLELAFLGSYSFRHEFNNIMTGLSYKIKTKYGTFTPMVIDYYYPYDRVPLKELGFDSTSFTHTVETGIQFVGDKVPLRVYVCKNVHNDPDYSNYMELGYVFKCKGMKVEPFAGIVFTPSPRWHAADKAGLFNVGFNVFKKVRVSEEFSLPLTGTLSYHTQLDMLNVMVRLSIF